MWFKRAIDYSDKAVKSNTGISSLSWLVVMVGWLIILTILVINVCMMIEMIIAHTIASSIEGYASIITALASLAAAVGIPKAINNYGENKFRGKPPRDEEESNDEYSGIIGEN